MARPAAGGRVSEPRDQGCLALTGVYLFAEMVAQYMWGYARVTLQEDKDEQRRNAR
jgi:hypothetical protein